MMKKVTLNTKEQKRVIVLNKVLEGQMTGQEVPESGGHRATGDVVNVIRKLGCCSKWMAANMTGWKGAGRG